MNICYLHSVLWTEKLAVKFLPMQLLTVNIMWYIWTMLLSDWCYSIKLWWLKFVCIRTIYSKDINTENLSGQIQSLLSFCFTVTSASKEGEDIKSKTQWEADGLTSPVFPLYLKRMFLKFGGLGNPLGFLHLSLLLGVPLRPRGKTNCSVFHH